DFMMSITEDDMNQIKSGIRNYQFLRETPGRRVQRIWYLVSGHPSPTRARLPRSLAFVCEVGPVRMRRPYLAPLIEDGVLNAEFNDTDNPLMDSLPFAFRICSVWELKTKFSVQTLR
ncbi:hypothetical protein SISSUDRAFT_962082, partial [Sistotremastrum suecicum HHB10207 ss-3]